MELLLAGDVDVRPEPSADVGWVVIFDGEARSTSSASAEADDHFDGPDELLLNDYAFFSFSRAFGG